MFDEKLRLELTIKTSRSGGAGGQHVNKTETRVELFFNIKSSQVLSDKQKQLLNKNLHSRLTQNGTLRIVVSETRSQVKNKEIAIQRFLTLIKKGLLVPKKRTPTKPSKGSVAKRLDSKTKKSEVKKGRGKIKKDDFE